jgi:DNA-binding GntR family transcriptional regulator
LRTLAGLHARSRRYVPYAYRDWRPLEGALAEHRRILEAVEAADPLEARRLTREHLEQAAERLLASVREEGSLS